LLRSIPIVDLELGSFSTVWMVIGKSRRIGFRMRWHVGTGCCGISDWKTEETKIDNLHQKRMKPSSTTSRGPRRWRFFARGRDDIYDQLTSRFCRGTRDKVDHKSLATVPAIREQQGKVQFAICVTYTQNSFHSHVIQRTSPVDGLGYGHQYSF
jgi:hypothetical protein